MIEKQPKTFEEALNTHGTCRISLSPPPLAEPDYYVPHQRTSSELFSDAKLPSDGARFRRSLDCYPSVRSSSARTSFLSRRRTFEPGTNSNLSAFPVDVALTHVKDPSHIAGTVNRCIPVVNPAFSYVTASPVPTETTEPTVPNVPAVPAESTVLVEPAVPIVSFSCSAESDKPTSQTELMVSTASTLPTESIVPTVRPELTVSKESNLPCASFLSTEPVVSPVPIVKNVPTISTDQTEQTVPAAPIMRTLPIIPAISTVPIVKNVPTVSIKQTDFHETTVPIVKTFSTAPSFRTNLTGPFRSNTPMVPNVPTVCNVNTVQVPVLDRPLQKANDVPDPSLVNEAKHLAERCWNADVSWMPPQDMASWLSRPNELSTVTRDYFIKRFDFHNMCILSALRALCARIYLHGEAGKIDQILEALSAHFVACNPNTRFHTKDCVHSVACSLLLLNTDLHLVELEQHMTMTQFVLNTCNMLQESEFFHDVPRDVKDSLEQMYLSVRTDPLPVPTECELKPEPKIRRALSRGRGTLSRAYRNSRFWDKQDRAQEFASYTGMPTLYPGCEMEVVAAADPHGLWRRCKSRHKFWVALQGEVLALYTKAPSNERAEPERTLSLMHALFKLTTDHDNACTSMTLPDGSVYLFYAPFATLLTLTDICQYTSACISCVPLPEGTTNTNYGWQHLLQPGTPTTVPAPSKPSFLTRLLPHTKPSMDTSLHTWTPPPPATLSGRSPLPREEQRAKLSEHVAYLQRELAVLERVKEPMLHYWHADRRAQHKAYENWSQKHLYLQKQLAQWSEYLVVLRCTPASTVPPQATQRRVALSA